MAKVTELKSAEDLKKLLDSLQEDCCGECDECDEGDIDSELAEALGEETESPDDALSNALVVIMKMAKMADMPETGLAAYQAWAAL